MKRIIFFILMCVACLSDAQNALYNGWGQRGNTLCAQTYSLGSVDNFSFVVVTNGTRRMAFGSDVANTASVTTIGSHSVSTNFTVAGNSQFTGTVNATGTVNIGSGTYGTDDLHQVRITKNTGTVDIGEFAAGRGAIWCNQAPPAVSNWQVSASANGADGYFNGSSSSRLLVNGSIITNVFSYGMTHLNRHEQSQGVDVASVAGAITLGSGGNVFELTGTDAVTLILNTNWQNGSEITLLFTSTASLTDGVANSGTSIGFELAGNANFSGSADDSITLVLSEIGGTQRWREKCRSVN